MAEKRMFTQKIIDSDAFLDMPLSTQALYFHLNMRADDDGFVNNPKKLQRYIGAGDDDLKLLLAKRFVIGFASGVIVIKHWRMHNTLRKDRYSPTQYQEELAMLDVKDNRAYTERVADVLPVVGRIIEEAVEAVEAADKPTLEDVIDYAESCQMAVNPRRFFTYYSERDWKTVNGTPIQWRMKLEEWDFDEKRKIATPSPAPTPQTSSNPFLDMAREEGIK